MDKFEYFPIKCRIQRAADMFRKSRVDVLQMSRASARKELAAENEIQVSQLNLRSTKSKVYMHT